MESHVAYDDLIAFAAQETPPSLSAAIAAHVSGCPRCAATVKYFAVAADSIRALGSELPSSNARAQVYKLASARTPTPSSWLASLGAFFSFPRPGLANATALVILALAVMLVGSVGTIAVSQNAVTGDRLYPVKTAMENAQVGLIPTDAGRTEQYMNMAGSRVAEIRILVQRQEFEGIPSTAAAYQAHVNAAINSLQSLFSQDAAQARTLATKVNATLDRYTSTLEILIDNVPVRIKPALASAVSVSAAAISTLIDLQTPPAVLPLPTATETPIASPAPAATESPVSQPSGMATTPSPVPSVTAPVVAPTTSVPTLEPTGTSTNEPPTITPTLEPTATSTSEPIATMTPTPPNPTDTGGGTDGTTQPPKGKNDPYGSPKTPGPPEGPPPGKK